MDWERGFVSSSSALSPSSSAEKAADRLELEAAEALAGLAYLVMRETTADSAAKWGSKGKRLRKRVKSESPPSDPGLNPADPVQTASDPAEEQDQSRAGQPQQQVEVKGVNVFLESIKAEQNTESLKPSPSCASSHKSNGGGRSRQNLTEAEKEERRLRRILANRESARQTIRRRQALCEELTQKATDLAQENERLKRERELAFNEYQSLESTNKYLKAEMAKAIKADEGEVCGEIRSAHLQMSAPPSTNCPFFFYNQHPFPPFCWPSMVQSSQQLQMPHRPQTAIVVPPNAPMPASGKLDPSQDPGNSTNVNGSKSPLYLVPCPWFFPLPDHGNGFHPQPSCHVKDLQDETSVSNQFSASASTKTVAYRGNHNCSIDIKVEKEAYGSIEEARLNDPNITPVKYPPDGGGQCSVVHPQENILVPTPLTSSGATFVVKQENLSDYISNVEASCIRASHSLNPSTVNNQEPVNYASKKVLDAAAAAEARKRRKELTKLKNLHGKQCRMQC